jgi:tetratricopeptide (TPR) repeat protein
MLQDGKPARARESFTRALKLDPGDPLSRLGLACALDAIGSTPTAIEELQLCLDARPEYCPAIVSMGYCFQKSGKPREAIQAYEQALRKNPKLRRTREKLAPINPSVCDKFPEINGQPEANCITESQNESKEVASAR